MVSHERYRWNYGGNLDTGFRHCRNRGNHSRPDSGERQIVTGDLQLNQNKMKTQWFKRLGWFYIPVSLPGGVITLAALAFCVQVFIAVDRHSHSASDTLYGVFPFFACAFLLFDWIAGRTSHQPD
jgi:hypothetical protein